MKLVFPLARRWSKRCGRSTTRYAAAVVSDCESQCVLEQPVDDRTRTLRTQPARLNDAAVRRQCAWHSAAGTCPSAGVLARAGTRSVLARAPRRAVCMAPARVSPRVRDGHWRSACPPTPCACEQTRGQPSRLCMHTGPPQAQPGKPAQGRPPVPVDQHRQSPHKGVPGVTGPGQASSCSDGIGNAGGRVCLGQRLHPGLAPAQGLVP